MDSVVLAELGFVPSAINFFRFRLVPMGSTFTVILYSVMYQNTTLIEVWNNFVFGPPEEGDHVSV